MLGPAGADIILKVFTALELLDESEVVSDNKALNHGGTETRREKELRVSVVSF
jgi:hypothetical protein